MFKEKMSITQTIILVIFGIAFVIGVVIISLGGKESNATNGGANYGKINIWGSFPEDNMRRFKNDLAEGDDVINGAISYTYVSDGELETKLLNAIADGTQPQMIISSNKNINTYKKRLGVIDLRYLSPAKIENNFVESSRVFMDEQGVWALPVIVDPMIMYYNKDIYATNSIANPPVNWDQFKDVVSKIAVRQDKEIVLSAAAIGTYQNIAHATELLLTLLLQTNIDFEEEIQFDENKQKNFVSTVSFFTLFSNSSFQNNFYTWNSSIKNSLDAFLTSEVSTIFAPASKDNEIREKNPNLNYQMAEVPHPVSQGSTYKATYADVYGISLVKNAENIEGSYRMFAKFMEEESLKKMATHMSLASAHKNIVSQTDGTTKTNILNKSAIYAKPVIIKDADGINSIFSDLVANIITGRNPINIGVRFAADEFDQIVQEDKKKKEEEAKQ